MNFGITVVPSSYPLHAKSANQTVRIGGSYCTSGKENFEALELITSRNYKVYRSLFYCSDVLYAVALFDLSFELQLQSTAHQGWNCFWVREHSLLEVEIPRMIEEARVSFDKVKIVQHNFESNMFHTIAQLWV